ncbi:MAG: helix-turn-helix domain-containing protein [Firmicutes bacterium]|nr:helix-turn-helix domain-containing protein [Bacillota bacterium]
MAFNIGGNIKKLRAEKGVTQEQLAQALSITCQSVSKWENDVTSPDLYLLPAIADYFGISIDELFQPNMQGYKNKAARLFALYEHRRTTENFLKAYKEYKSLIAQGKADAEDYRDYGILNQFQAQRLNQKAEEALKKSIELGEGQRLSSNTSKTNITVAEASEGQLRYLLERTGRNDENIERYEQAVKDDPGRIRNWCCLIDSYAADDPEKALALARECLVKFPDGGDLLFFRCAYLCKDLKRLGEAEAYFKKGAEANPDDGSNYYHMAFMYTEMKEYEKAIGAWEEVVALCGRLGLAEEEAEMNREWPEKEIAKLRALMDAAS